MTLRHGLARDQAEGLRQMFAHTRARFVPVVSNPNVAFGGVMLERLCTSFAERGAHVLVIDAGERAGEYSEMALVELGQCVERLSAQVSFLAARGLPVRFVDATGSSRGFLRAAAEASPRSDVVLVHASAPELCRMFSPLPATVERAGDSDSEVVPVVFCDDRPASVTHAYGSVKLLAQRTGLVVFDLLLGAAPQSPRAGRIVAKLASCADSFFGGVLRHAARIDPAGDATEPPGTELRRIAAARIGRAAAAIPPLSHRPAGAYVSAATP